MIPRSGSRSVVVAALVAVAVAGCTGVASTNSPATTPKSSPESIAALPTAPGGSSEGVAPVTTPEEAVARVVATEPRFAGISARDPELIGQASWYAVEPALGAMAYRVTFRVGSGDCQSGCIDEHRWVYDVARDGSVSLVSQSGDAASPDPSPG